LGWVALLTQRNKNREIKSVGDLGQFKWGDGTSLVDSQNLAPSSLNPFSHKGRRETRKVTLGSKPLSLSGREVGVRVC